MFTHNRCVFEAPFLVKLRTFQLKLNKELVTFTIIRLYKLLSYRLVVRANGFRVFKTKGKKLTVSNSFKNFSTSSQLGNVFPGRRLSRAIVSVNYQQIYCRKYGPVAPHENADGGMEERSSSLGKTSLAAVDCDTRRENRRV